MNPSLRCVAAAALALAATLCTPAQAQTPDAARIKELEAKLERSLALIEQLSARIQRIEQANAPPAATPAVQAEAKVAALERRISELGDSQSRRSAEDALPVHGFADVGLVRSGEDNVSFKGRKGAALGMFDLYLTPQFGDRVRSLIELAFEAEANGETAADLERMQIGYTFGDAATVWLGRFHTPFGYWNTAFHHGAQIQTAIMRPRFLEFEGEGGVLPAHTTGVWLDGTWATARGRVGYDVFAGNAPQINGVSGGSALAAVHPAGFSNAVNSAANAGSGTLNLRQRGSSSHRTSAGFNAWLEPDAWDGLRLGVHGLRADVIDDAAASANRTLLKMFGGYFAYAAEPWEALGEYYQFRNQDKSGGSGTHASWAAYAQIGYKAGKWTPFVRAERSKLDQTDNYFGVQEDGRSYRRLAAGLRFDVDPKAALKLEMNSTRKQDLGPGAGDDFPELHLQYAIRF